MTKTAIFALDLGNKQTKLKSSKAELVYPSVLINKREVAGLAGLFQGTPKDVNELKINGDTESYYWGNGILNYSKNKLIDSLGFGNRYRRPVYRLLNEFSLGILSKNFTEEELQDVEVVVGLPTGDYSEEVITEVKRLLQDKPKSKQSHLITVDDEEKIVRISKVTTLPQPIGTFYNIIVDDAGEIVHEELLDKRIAIVDLGGGTQLLDQIDHANLDAVYRAQFETGSNDLYVKIRTTIQQELGVETDIHKIETLIREGMATGKFVYKQSDSNIFDISDIVQSAISYYTDTLINNISTTYQNLAEVDMIVVTGGTANIIDKQKFENAFDGTVKIMFVENSETANVSGFYKYALFQQINGND